MALRTIEKNNTVGNIQSINKDGEVILSNTDYRNVIGSFKYEVGGSKENIQFIKRVEKTIRTSQEYSNYIKYLRVDKGIIEDSMMSAINSDNATIEMHHFPFNLFDITMILFDHHVDNNIQFTSLSLAEDVMKLHYSNKVGLVSLAKTTHELYHQGKLKIGMDQIFGNVNEFVSEYFDYIPDDLKETYNKLIDLGQDLPENKLSKYQEKK